MSLPTGRCDCEAAAAVREELAEWRTVAIAALALALLELPGGQAFGLTFAGQGTAV